MINELTIKGLKCFEEAEFHFKNLTLLAGKIPWESRPLFRHCLQWYRRERILFAGEYIDIGKISELKNKYVGSKEIEITVNQKITRHMTDDKNDVISEGKLSDEMSFKYLAARKCHCNCTGRGRRAWMFTIIIQVWKIYGLCVRYTKGSQKYEVLSIYSPRYLAQNHYIDLNIDRCDYLKIRYEGTRIDCSLLEKKSGPDQLKESEYKQLLGTLDKFVQHESWDTIDRDDGLEYKKYRGAVRKIILAGYSQTIRKFRYSGKQRVFGIEKETVPQWFW